MRTEEEARLLAETQWDFVGELHCSAQAIKTTHREVQKGVQIHLTFCKHKLYKEKGPDLNIFITFRKQL